VSFFLLLLLEVQRRVFLFTLALSLPGRVKVGGIRSALTRNLLMSSEG
jgi:hypothetical protein